LLLSFFFFFFSFLFFFFFFFFFFFGSQVEDGSLLYFSTIEDLMSNLKLVPFNSPTHVQLRRQLLSTYQSVPPVAPQPETIGSTLNVNSTGNSSYSSPGAVIGTMANPYASSSFVNDTVDVATTAAALPAGKAHPLVFHRDGGVVLQFEPRPLAAPPETVDTATQSPASTAIVMSTNSAASTTVVVASSNSSVQERSPPSSAKPAGVKKPSITREQAEAAGYSEAPNNLKQLHEKKMAEKFAQKMAASAGGGQQPTTTLVATTPISGATLVTRTSFENFSKLAADDLGSGDLVGGSADEDDADDDDDSDSDLSRDFARFNNVPRVDSSIVSSNSVVGSEDLFDSFAARYQTKGASRLGDESHASGSAHHASTDDGDESSSSRDSSLPPYVVPQKANVPRVPPAILVTNATPLTVTTNSGRTVVVSPTPAASATQVDDVEKMLDQLLSGPIEMHDLERLRGSLLQAMRQVNARIDEMLVGGGGQDEPKKKSSKKSSSKSGSGSTRRKSRKKVDE
jgi:hypothetical protein